jgi:hypothetical protein
VIELDGPVGQRHGDAPHDVAAVLAMLSVVRNNAGLPYYQGDYRTPLKPGLLSHLIETFQVERGLVPAKPGPPQPGGEPRGLVRKGGATWNLLVERLPPRLRGLRTLAGTTVAYLPMPRWKFDKNVTLFRAGSRNLWGHFAEAVLKLFRDFYAQSGISLVLMDDGAWRPFEDQLYMNSSSGPGETIHHYGYAVDIGFDGLQYLDKNGAIVTADRGLKDLGYQNQHAFFSARNKVAPWLHATILGGDLYHMQAYEDEPLDSVGSFMKLLQAVGPRRMKWTPRYRSPTDYLCDLGLGGDQYYVGTATDVWKQSKAHRISRADLALALNTRRKKEPAFSVETYLGIKDTKLPSSGPISDEQLTEAHLAAVQVLLKAEFLAAEAKWALWEPVRYSGAERRQQNTRVLDAPGPRPPRKRRLVR